MNLVDLLSQEGQHGTTAMATTNGPNQVLRVKYWIDWFLGLPSNNYFCKVDDSFIMDRFNLTKLDEYVPRYYWEALDMLIDKFGRFDLVMIILPSLF